MIFCLDLGSTRLKCGVMQQGELQQELFFPDDDLTGAVRRVLDTFMPRASILSSVIDHPQELETLLAAHTTFIRLQHSMPLPIQLAYDKPETLGVDRIALAAGAWSQFPGQHSLIIGTGSAITYNFLHKTGAFLGGGISPG